ncbi:cation:proton antiporter [Candidatus Woesearchaeota archaeon]|nr:cation:proton antiporter [Candidatus Woesearchaeota archaeon]
MVDVSISLFTIAFIIALGFFADLFFKRSRIPDVIWLIFFGVIIGPIFKIVDRETLFGTAPLFTAIAIAIILFESGRKMRFKELLRDALSTTIFMLANLVMSTILVAVGAKFFFGLGWENALLLGVIVAGTSSAMIVTVVDRLGISLKVKTIMSVESVINSPFVIVVGLVLMDSLVSPQSIFSFSTISSNIVKSFSVSIVSGLLIGIVWARLLNYLQKDTYHHMMTISVLFLTYVLAEYLGGSGALAALALGITLGNFSVFSKIFRKKIVVLTKETKDFNAMIAFVIRTFFFVFLGAVVSLQDYRSIVIGLVLTLIILAARFIIVYPTALIMKLERRELWTMGFMIPTGLSAAVLAILPFTQYGIAGTESFVDIVFTIILATTILATVGVGIVEYVYNRRETIKKKNPGTR